MSSPKPSAAGKLGTTPLDQLLVSVLDRRLTGTVVIEALDGGKSAIYLDGGVPLRARTAAPLYLASLLVELGFVERTTAESTLRMAVETKQLHGALLVAQGVLAADVLREALREQLYRRVLYMAALPPSSVYGFYQNVNYLERFGGADAPPARPLELIWRTAREHADPARVEAARRRLGDSVLRCHPEAPIQRFGFQGGEQAVIDVLRAKPQPLAELERRELCDQVALHRLLYTLMVTRCLALPGSTGDPLFADDEPVSSRPLDPSKRISGHGSGYHRAPSSAGGRAVRLSATPSRVPAVQPSASDVSDASEAPTREHHADVRAAAPPEAPRPVHPKRPTLPSSPELPDVAAMKAEIVERATAVGQSYYAILGVANDATGNEIQTAFFKLAKKWHPDRLGAEYDDVRDQVTKAFARMSEAHQILADPKQRQAYDHVLAEGGGSADEQERVQAVIRAATAYQRAEVFFKKQNFEAAEREARRAVEEDPEQADYVALLAWLESLKPGANLEAIIGQLNEAVHREATNQRARFYRGQLYKRLGKDARAINDFRAIIEQNPHHLEAAREIRLFEMRKGTDKTDKDKTPGGLGKWFKR
jgi:curved DNA-binding protein CbpA